MTKAELFELLADVPDDMEIMIEGEFGYYPICFTESEINEDEVLGDAFVLAPCYCDEVDEEMIDKAFEELKKDPIEMAIIKCENKELN